MDQAFDLANMIFGGALGAYVGVVIAQDNVAINKVVWLVFGLVSIGMTLVGLRQLAHKLRGTHVGPKLIDLLTAVGGVVLAMSAFSHTGFRVDVIGAFMAGWIFFVVYLLGSHVVRRFRSKT